MNIRAALLCAIGLLCSSTLLISAPPQMSASEFNNLRLEIEGQIKGQLGKLRQDITGFTDAQLDEWQQFIESRLDRMQKVDAPYARTRRTWMYEKLNAELARRAAAAPRVSSAPVPVPVGVPSPIVLTPKFKPSKAEIAVTQAVQEATAKAYEVEVREVEQLVATLHKPGLEQLVDILKADIKKINAENRKAQEEIAKLVKEIDDKVKAELAAGGAAAQDPAAKAKLDEAVKNAEITSKRIEETMNQALATLKNQLDAVESKIPEVRNKIDKNAIKKTAENELINKLKDKLTTIKDNLSKQKINPAQAKIDLEAIKEGLIDELFAKIEPNGPFDLQNITTIREKLSNDLTLVNNAIDKTTKEITQKIASLMQQNQNEVNDLIKAKKPISAAISLNQKNSKTIRELINQIPAGTEHKDIYQRFVNNQREVFKIIQNSQKAIREKSEKYIKLTFDKILEYMNKPLTEQELPMLKQWQANMINDIEKEELFGPNDKKILSEVVSKMIKGFLGAPRVPVKVEKIASDADKWFAEEEKKIAEEEKKQREQLSNEMIANFKPAVEKLKKNMQDMTINSQDLRAEITRYRESLEDFMTDHLFDEQLQQATLAAIKLPTEEEIKAYEKSIAQKITRLMRQNQDEILQRIGNKQSTVDILLLNWNNLQAMRSLIKKLPFGERRKQINNDINKNQEYITTQINNYDTAETSLEQQMQDFENKVSSDIENQQEAKIIKKEFEIFRTEFRQKIATLPSENLKKEFQERIKKLNEQITVYETQQEVLGENRKKVAQLLVELKNKIDAITQQETKPTEETIALINDVDLLIKQIEFQISILFTSLSAQENNNFNEQLISQKNRLPGLKESVENALARAAMQDKNAQEFENRFEEIMASQPRKHETIYFSLSALRSAVLESRIISKDQKEALAKKISEAITSIVSEYLLITEEKVNTQLAALKKLKDAVKFKSDLTAAEENLQKTYNAISFPVASMHIFNNLETMKRLRNVLKEYLTEFANKILIPLFQNLKEISQKQNELKEKIETLKNNPTQTKIYKTEQSRLQYLQNASLRAYNRLLDTWTFLKRNAEIAQVLTADDLKAIPTPSTV